MSTTTVSPTESKIPRDYECKVHIFKTNHEKMIELPFLLHNLPQCEMQLSRFLEPISDYYSHIIIDNPPSLNIIPVTSLVASQFTLVPIEPDPLSIIGLSSIFATINRVKRDFNPELQVIGVVPSRVRVARKRYMEAIEEINQGYPDLVLPYIKDLVEVEDANMSGSDIFSALLWRVSRLPDSVPQALNVVSYAFCWSSTRVTFLRSMATRPSIM